MGNRAECPVCKAWTSGVYASINYDMKPCPHCECPYEVLVKWNTFREEIEEHKEKKTNKDLIKKIHEVEIQNAVLESKLRRLEQILIYNRDVLKPFNDAIKILNNEVVNERSDDDE